MAFKLVISDPKSGKSFQKEFEQTGILVGKKIGETLSGEAFGLSGYELQITGGSDKIGVPMRKDVEGAASRRLLLTKGVGYRAKFKIKKDGKVWYDAEPAGARKKKRVRGNTIGPEMIQVNLIVVKAGHTSLDKIFPPKEKKEEKPAELAKA
ncbi:TPA: 30S ribosomal protein S6e [archaeon]|nr:30S ribosomal protein S6e [Candidatus Naiadarchaeales archaeon SRR2090153.bin1042]